MKIINGYRRSGKSYKVLQSLTVNDLYVSSTMKRCQIAYEEWIKIHKPKKKDSNLSSFHSLIRPSFTTYREFFSTSLRGLSFNNVYIEDIELYFQEVATLCGVYGKITCTSTANIEQLPTPEEIRELIEKYNKEEVDFGNN